MSKICAKCSKAVYPLEELKCLDKIWHKGCFRCWECNMTLNMKNYKGYDKKPYCSAHYPQTKATVVADTPELQRLTRNTELQSQVKYHEEFEKKIKGSKIQVTDDPETQRLKQVNSVVSQVEYKGIREKTGNMESRRQSLPPTSEKKEKWTFVNSSGQSADPTSPFSDRSTSTSIVYKSDGKVEAPRQKRIGSIADYDPVNENYGSLTQGYNPVSRMSQSQEWEETVPVSPSMVGKQTFTKEEKTTPTEKKAPDQLVDVPKVDTIGKKEDKEADNEEDVFHNDLHNGTTLNKAVNNTENEVLLTTEMSDVTMKKDEASGVSFKDTAEVSASDLGVQRVALEEADERKLASEDIVHEKHDETSLPETGDNFRTDEKEIEDLSSVTSSNVLETKHEQISVAASEPDAETRNKDRIEEKEAETPKDAEEEEDAGSPEDKAKVTETKPLPGTFVALYDYEAQDEDEVGFSEGDHIVDCESVDAGWMIGTVTRTGERGMLPSNYVEQVI